MLELVCSGCGSTVAEVIGTTPGPVLTYRQADISDTPDDARNEYRLRLLSNADDDFPHDGISAGCTCAKHFFLLGPEVYDQLAAGVSKKVLTPGARLPRSGPSRDIHRTMRQAVRRRNIPNTPAE
jgi:hypothetical protein